MAGRQDPEERERSRIAEGASLLRDLAIIFGIFIYFAGFQYFYYYRQDLGLPVDDVPTFYLCVYGYMVLGRYLWQLALFGLAIYGISQIWIQSSRHIRPNIAAVIQFVCMVLLVCTTLGAFRVLSDEAKTTARDKIRELWEGSDQAATVIRWTKECPAGVTVQSLHDLCSANVDSRLWIVSESAQEVYAFERPRVQADMPLPVAWVYAIPKSAIAALEHKVRAKR